ncbi:cache domain-containing protein [Ferrovibrio terrae]|uniref:cache domain-containing protein n=1 Tax=Ferrovibrio terrae TaxID=2594003 RepID=UPI00313796BA
MSIGGRLKLIVLCVAVVAVMLIGGIGLGTMRYLIDAQEQDLAERARLHLENAIEVQAAANRAMAAALAALPAVQRDFLADDRAALQRELDGAFVSLSAMGITNLHLHRANTTSLLRLHRPQQFDDDLSTLRPMIREVNETRTPRQGIEPGLHGLPIRGAVPVFAPDGRHLGALEVGSFLTSDFLHIFQKPGTAYSIYLLRDGRPTLIAQSDTATAQPFPAAQIAQAAQAGLAQKLPTRRGQAGEQFLVSTLAPLPNYDGRIVGAVQIDIDTSKLESVFDREIQLQLAGVLLVVLLAACAVVFGMRPILARIDRLIAVTNAIAAEQPVTVPMLEQTDEFGRFARALEKFRLSQVELGLARDRAQTASIAKSNFLAVMSHELRTPLNAIIGFTELMLLRRAQNRPFGERETEYLNDILHSAMHLMALVEDVLTNAAIDTGGLTVKLEPTNLTIEVANILRLLEPRARHAEQTLEIDLADGLPPVMADPRALHQICLNVVSNALKFTPRGGRIAVGVGLDGDAFWIRVSDSGPGIPAHHLQHVTEAFYQAADAQARSSSSGGVGLGLTIAHRLALLLGGRLDLANRPEGGLTVTLVCPARSTEAQALLQQATASVA